MLTTKGIAALKPKDRPYKVHDRLGLFMVVMPTGSRWWRVRYTLGGKCRELSAGVYPAVGLAEARAKRDAIRLAVSRGEDPAGERRAAKRPEAELFGAVVAEYLKVRISCRAANTQANNRCQARRLTAAFGELPIQELTAARVLAEARRMEDAGRDPRHMLRLVGSVSRYALATGRPAGDPTKGIAGALRPRSVRHHAAPGTPAELGEIMTRLRRAPMSETVRGALMVLYHTAQRPSEVAGMRWQDLITLEGPLPTWKNLASKVGATVEVPLTPPVIAILRAQLGHDETFVFPASTGPSHVSTTSMLACLHKAGVSSTPHGARAAFRTMADEILDERIDLLEVMLGHRQPGPLGACYARARHVEGRRGIASRWSAYLVKLEAEAAAAAA
jgi:integrase